MSAVHQNTSEHHHRQIDLRFYHREDGLYEVEGRLVDRKTVAFRRQLSEVDSPPGDTLHDITVTLVFDAAMWVHDARAHMRATPFDICPGAEATLKPLIGLQMAGGWNKSVRTLLKGARSCTHIVELLGPLATTAYQGLAPLRLAQINQPENEAQRRAKVDSCFAYAAERSVVARLWPELHRSAPGPGGDTGLPSPIARE